MLDSMEECVRSEARVDNALMIRVGPPVIFF